MSKRTRRKRADKRARVKQSILPYRSMFEKEGAAKHPALAYEPYKLTYFVESSYTPDFSNAAATFMLEYKGRFRTRTEARNYLAIRECNPDIELIFVFQNPRCPMPGAQQRSNGTKQTMAEWAKKNGFKWYTIHTLPKVYTK